MTSLFNKKKKQLHNIKRAQWHNIPKKDVLRQIIYIAIVDSMFRIANMIYRANSKKTNEIVPHPKCKSGSSTTINFITSFKIDE